MGNLYPAWISLASPVYFTLRGDARTAVRRRDSGGVAVQSGGCREAAKQGSQDAGLGDAGAPRGPRGPRGYGRLG